MTDAQYIGIQITLILILLILEIGMITVCDHLKAIRRYLEEVVRRSGHEQ